MLSCMLRILSALKGAWHKADAYNMFIKPHAILVQLSGFCLSGAPGSLQYKHSSS